MKKISVFLDANILSWFYGEVKSSPKKFDLKKEIDSLKRIGFQNSLDIEFFYNYRDPLKKFLEEYANKVIDDFKNFIAWGDILVLDEARKNVENFRKFFKNSNEKQDDIEHILPSIIFFAKKKIKYIITLDVKFANRLSELHGKIKKDNNFEQRLLKIRPDFYEIKIMIPTEFEKFLLRHQLNQITSQNIGKNIAKQVDLIKNIGMSHSIILKQEAIVGNPSTFQFNCFMYALNLINNFSVEKIMKEYKQIFIGSEFMKYLTENKLQEVDFSKKKDGDIIIYYSKHKLEHAGKIFSTRIMSKWGTGHMWEHDIFEIPITYGNTYRIYKQISKKDALNYFINYARSKGAKIH
ncbi:MAG: hypothetical protein KKA52_05255 [Candidatus Omnitrophica bacterium]|nr:hypothetical protein [Candidatus Omnitrophota bacterium]